MEPPDQGKSPDPRSRFRNRLAIGAALALLVGGVVFLALKPVSRQDEPAPQFSLPLLEGDGELSSEELEGKPVVVNFWASWCEPCKEELPAFQTISERYEGAVTVVGINVRDTPEEAVAMAERFGITYPLVVGDRAVQRDFDIFGLPQTFFITADYTLMGDAVEPSEGPDLLGEDNANTSGLGAITEKQLENEIEKLLSAAEEPT